VQRYDIATGSFIERAVVGAEVVFGGGRSGAETKKDLFERALRVNTFAEIHVGESFMMPHSCRDFVSNRPVAVYGMQLVIL
jgi:hypothetical protein